MTGRLGALVALVSIVAAVCASAQQPPGQPIPPIDDPALDARYQALIHEVRCLVCENRSIAESPSDVAHDLKKLIHEMVLAGKSDAEIAEFLAARYGDSILYRPPVQPNTWVLWGGPAVLLLLGAFVFVRIVRARAAQPIEEDEPE
ncbi:MAG TPA: cytochrome c-type biogenesis protein [Gammaproteobacteria bacterium]|jgi:cytochrome c-type biogenesis protein CcmH